MASKEDWVSRKDLQRRYRRTGAVEWDTAGYQCHLRSPRATVSVAQVSDCILQTAQTWANAGVCSDFCAHAHAQTYYVCLFELVCLFVCLFVLQAI